MLVLNKTQNPQYQNWIYRLCLENYYEFEEYCYETLTNSHAIQICQNCQMDEKFIYIKKIVINDLFTTGLRDMQNNGNNISCMVTLKSAKKLIWVKSLYNK